MSRCHKKYDLNLLNEIIKRDSIIIDLNNIKKVSSLVRLDFICKCGTPGNKTFRLMFQNGSMCKNCTLKDQQMKSKISCLEKYGVEHSTQNKEVQEKIKNTFKNNPHKIQEKEDKKKKTCLEKYGFEYATQNKEIQDKIESTTIQKYGVKRASQLEEYKNKAENTCLKKYGVKYATQLSEYREKIIKTNLKRYGVKSSIQLPKFKEKRVQTTLKRYGVINVSQLPKFKQKRIDTTLKKYGLTSVFKLQSVKDKSQETCLKRYGVKHISHAKLPSKIFKFKLYTFPCGNITHVQGYEPFALDDLVKEGYTYSDILTDRSDVPDIWYEGKDGKTHRYFVDIYIPKINKMIEVKSKWTYDTHHETVLLKAKECIKNGYNYEIWLYDYKKNKVVL